MTGNKKPEGVEKVRFFNVSLVNANVMSTPRFPQPQRLIGELIHSIEAASPRFAWVQFLFQRADYHRWLRTLKNDINLAVAQIKAPKKGVITGKEYERPELYRDWYKSSGDRIKQIDSLVNAPQVLLAIQGMWVGDDPYSLLELPFRDCYDDHDRLGVFPYRNPWMLVELVERRMVEDVSAYFMSYTRSRLEPPSFLITQEEIPYYIHLPVANTDFLKSLTDRGPYSPDIQPGGVEGGKESGESSVTAPVASRVKALVLAKVPKIAEPLREEQLERLALLPSTAVRGFEVLFREGATQILLSSKTERDLKEYLGVMESVYGTLDVVETPAKPGFLRELPRIVQLQ